jgi:uncharacterized protein YciI
MPRSETSTGVAFLVHCRDAVGVEDRLQTLADEHWDYIDRFGDQLIARGPTTTADGGKHTGSIHVLSASDSAAAWRFANEEPYRRAGLYADVSVIRFENLLGRTMWDRPPSTEPLLSTFLLARSATVTLVPADVRAMREVVSSQPDVWVFLGLQVSDDGKQCIGAAAAADLPPEPAVRALRSALPSLRLNEAQIETSRWQRGGRRR